MSKDIRFQYLARLDKLSNTGDRIFRCGIITANRLASTLISDGFCDDHFYEMMSYLLSIKKIDHNIYSRTYEAYDIAQISLRMVFADHLSQAILISPARKPFSSGSIVPSFSDFDKVRRPAVSNLRHPTPPVH